MLLLGDRLRQSLSKQGIPVAPGSQAPTDSSPTSTDARSPETTEAKEAGSSLALDQGRGDSGNPNDEWRSEAFSERQYLGEYEAGARSLENRKCRLGEIHWTNCPAQGPICCILRRARVMCWCIEAGRLTDQRSLWQWYRMSEPQVAYF